MASKHANNFKPRLELREPFRPHPERTLPMAQQPPTETPAPRTHTVMIELERVQAALQDARARLTGMRSRYKDLEGIGNALDLMDDGIVSSLGYGETVERIAKGDGR